MKRLMSLLCVVGIIAAVTLSHSAFADDPATEEGVPFRGSMGGNETQQFVFPPEPGPPTGFHILGRGTGHATHLDRYTVNWTFFDATIDAAGNASARGHCHFMAANGDSLLTVAIAEGTPPDENGIISVVETHTITPSAGTGRFAGASGNFTQRRLVQVSTEGAINYTFGSLEGTIVLASN